METELVLLDLIDPNPYQPREREDPEHVQKIAHSIWRKGMLQPPVGRRVNGRVQLMFGHTRLAAHKWLRDQGVSGFEAMAMVIQQDCLDIDMFEGAIRENVDRKDLSPIEQAQGMRKYREEFGKTSVEIGLLFGLSESAVRNKMRLLDLPDEVRSGVESGDLSEGVARKLLAVQRVAPEVVSSVAEMIQTGGADSPARVSETILRGLNGRKDIRQIWDGRWNNIGKEPCAGVGLWPLTWAPGVVLGQEKVKQFAKLHPENIHTGAYANRVYEFLQGHPDGDLMKMCDDPYHYNIEHDGPEAVELADAAFRFLRPPACTACPVHAAIDTVHYCGQPACWKNKREIWYQVELAAVSERLGVQIYDPERDGKDFESAGEWKADRDQYVRWLRDKADHLRGRVKYTEYSTNALTDNAVVELISVGDKAKARRVAERNKELQQKEQEANRDQSYEIMRSNIRKAELFIERVAAPILAVSFKGMNSGMLRVLLGGMNYGHVDGQKDFAGLLTKVLLMRVVDYSAKQQGVLATAKFVQGVATEMGVTMPDNWSVMAEDADKQMIVDGV